MISALRAAREHAPLVGVWLLGVVALVAYAVSGCPVTVPGWCSCGVSLFLVGCFADRVAVCPRDCLFVACGVLRRALLVCCCLCCLAAIVWCAFRECSRTACDAVHAGLCECAFDGNRDCRLFFTV